MAVRSKHRFLAVIFFIALMAIVLPESRHELLYRHVDAVNGLPPRPLAPKQDRIPVSIAEAVTTAPLHTSKHTQGTRLQDAWSLQIGRFTSQEAELWLQTLRQQGFSAYSKPLRHSDLQQVYVGPELNPHTLQLIQQKIAKQYGLSAKIVSFQPATFSRSLLPLQNELL